MSEQDFLNIQVDVSGAEEYLRDTSLTIPQIEKKVLRLVGKLAARQTNTALKSSVHAKSNSVLAHRYPYKMTQTYKYGKVKNHSLSIFPNKVEGGSRNDLIIPVSMTLNYGYDAGNRRGPHVVGRGFVQAGENYLQGGRYMPEVQNLVDKEIEKYNAKFQ